MCENSNTIKFCSCSDTDDVKKDKNAFYWTLSRLIGLKEDKMIGKVLGPTADLGEGITVEAIAEKLNEGTCFDFDYQPSENDTVSVSRSSDNYRYFTLIYRAGHWREGNNPSFISINEKIASGVLEIDT